MSFSIIYQCRPYSSIDMIKKLKFCPEDDQIIALLKVYWSTNNNQLFVSKAARFYTCKSHQRWNSFQSTLHYFWKKNHLLYTTFAFKYASKHWHALFELTRHVCSRFSHIQCVYDQSVCVYTCVGASSCIYRLFCVGSLIFG